MSAFAQNTLDAVYDSIIADSARMTPTGGAAAFSARVFQLEPDQPLGVGLQSAPILGTALIEVRKSEWPQPVRQDLIEVLGDDGVTVVRRLKVVDDPLSLDDKRLTWTINCVEA